jgi:hypothetical protein
MTNVTAKTLGSIFPSHTVAVARGRNVSAPRRQCGEQKIKLDCGFANTRGVVFVGEAAPTRQRACRARSFAVVLSE